MPAAADPRCLPSVLMGGGTNPRPSLAGFLIAGLILLLVLVLVVVVVRKSARRLRRTRLWCLTSGCLSSRLAGLRCRCCLTCWALSCWVGCGGVRSGGDFIGALRASAGGWRLRTGE